MKVRENFGRFQLGDSGLWLVKLLQAAVASGAPEFRVTFARRKVCVVFTPRTRWDAEEILAALASPTTTSDRALSHLAIGLCACASPAGQTISWSLGDKRIVLDGKAPRVTAKPHQAEFLFEASRPPRKLAWGKLLVVPLQQVIRQTLEEWSALASRSWPSPIPVFVDGRPLRTGLDAVPHMGLHSSLPRRNTSLFICLGARPLFAAASRPQLTLPASWRNEPEFKLSPGPQFFGTFLRWNLSSPSPRGYLSLHASVSVGPTVDFVLDGAVVESRTIAPIMEFGRSRSFVNRALLMPRYLFPVEPHEVDLSQFAVRGIDELELYRQSINETKELINVIVPRFSEYRVRAGDERRLLRNGIKDLVEVLES